MKTIILISYLAIWFSIGSCQIDSNLSGNRGISNNIEESKKRDVFIAEYTTKQNPYIISDSLKIHITEAWLEVLWYYGREFNETKPGTKFRICIKVAPLFSLKNYDETWVIGDGSDGGFGQSSRNYNFLTCVFESVPREVEIFPVFKGSFWELRKNNAKEKIGEFEIIKKK